MTLPAVVVTAGGAGKNPSKINREKNQKKKEQSSQKRKEKNLQKDESRNPKLEPPTKESNNMFLKEVPRISSKKTKRKLKGRPEKLKSLDSLYKIPESTVALPSSSSQTTRNLWLLICFLGIMFSFVLYGLLLEYATSGGRKLHELSFLFITSGLYTIAGAAGRHIRDETPTQIPPARFAVLGLTSMGSTYCSVRSLRYVIYPIQVLAKACKPVPVMIMATFLGKYYPPRKYVNVVMIVLGVALFMGGGAGGGGKDMGDDEMDASSQIMGILLLFVSLCFDGATGAYEDKLMAVHQVEPFDLMYNIQLGKTILAGVGLVVLNQVHEFLWMCQDMGFLLIALGLSGALGQAFIFVTISKFGALTCSIIGLARKVTTLVASIIVYGHMLTSMQVIGLLTAVAAMVLNFLGKTKRKKPTAIDPIKEEEAEEEVQNLLYTDSENEDSERDHLNDEEAPAPVLGGNSK